MKLMEERDAQRRKAKEEALEKWKQEREEKEQQRNIALRKVVSNQNRILAESKRRAEEKEAHIEEMIRKHEEERIIQLAKAREEEELRLQRQLEFKANLDQERAKKNMEVMEKDERATKKLEDIKEGYREKQRKAVEGATAVQQMLNEHKEKHAAELEEKRKKSDERLAKKAATIEEQRQNLANKRERNNLIKKLHEEKNVYGVVRQSRKDDYTRKGLELKYLEKVRRIEEFEKTKLDNLLAKLKRREQIIRKKQIVHAQVQTTLRRCGGSNLKE
jgi:hypothetical protein